MFRVFAVAMMFATASGADARDEVAAAGGLGGRSGATKERTVVVGCANPDADANPPHGFASALAAGIKGAAAVLDPKTLRHFAEGGSSDWMTKKPRSKEELLKQLPPKYQPLVKEYFEKLETMQHEKK